MLGRTNHVRLIVSAALMALIAPLVARLRPETMHRVLETRLRAPRPSTCSDEAVVLTVDRVLSRSPRRSRNRCLVRGITAYRLLRSSGGEPHLVFGARLVDSRLEAHCWLSDGVAPIFEATDALGPFEEMFRITSGGVVVRR